MRKKKASQWSSNKFYSSHLINYSYDISGRLKYRKEEIQNCKSCCEVQMYLLLVKSYQMAGEFPELLLPLAQMRKKWSPGHTRTSVIPVVMTKSFVGEPSIFISSYHPTPFLIDSRRLGTWGNNFSTQVSVCFFGNLKFWSWSSAIFPTDEPQLFFLYFASYR